MYRVAALYVVERYKPHVLEDARRALRRARLAQVSDGGHPQHLSTADSFVLEEPRLGHDVCTHALCRDEQSQEGSIGCDPVHVDQR